MSTPSQAMLRRAEQASWGRRPAARQGKILRSTSFRNPAGTMLGFISAELPSGMIIHSMKLMVAPRGRRWIAMPAEKRVDSDGKPVIGPDGKPLYHQLIEFRDKATSKWFRDQILELLRSAHPDAFDDGSAP
jgi:DNA-binding cell septation regulator SpoVG